MSPIPKQLQRLWIHSHEEDTGNLLVYRPAGYDLPPARGREGMRFKRGGEFEQMEIGPTDRSQVSRGRWTAGDAENVVLITPGHGAPRRLEIVSVDDDKLVARRLDE